MIMAEVRLEVRVKKPVQRTGGSQTRTRGQILAPE